MTEANKCTSCGSPLASSVRGGLCPACLLQRGLETNTVGYTEDLSWAASAPASDQDRTRWTPPTAGTLAPLFPELEILELIGRGGMGAVYKAREKQLDRLVALKILPPEIGREEAFAQRFAREAQAMAKLSHPNIVTIYSFGSRPLTAGGQRAAGDPAGGDLYFFIMEYVDGLSLRQLLDAGTEEHQTAGTAPKKHRRAISPKEALAIVPQICDALQYAHDRGIVHRDIKPENILLNKAGQVKIADFGLAKLVGLTAGAGAATTADPTADAGRSGAPGSSRRSSAQADVTQAGGKVMGTPQYMAPEQIERPREVDHRADIYSLGVVFYQMLTGELPKGKFEPPSRKVLIDVRLDEVVLRALEREPARRYQQVSEVRTQVETIVAGNAPSDQPAQQINYGWEYRSTRTLWGLPLLHIAEGYDPNTGRPRQAKGIIAWGSSAKGVIAMGGRATGIVAFGGLAVGVIAFGGLAMGLISFGGLVLAALFAYGGVTFGPIAIGGVAVGLYVEGGFRTSVYRLPSDWTMYASILFYSFFAALGVLAIWLTTVAKQHRPWGSQQQSGRGQDAHDTHRRDAHAAHVALDRARQAVKAPAIGLIVTAGVNVVALVVLVALLVFVPRLLWLTVPFAFFVLPTNSVVFAGAIRMTQLRNRGLAITAAYLAIIAGGIVGIVFGIWALIVLYQKETSDAFEAAQHTQPAIRRRPLRPAWWSIASHVVLLAVIIVGVAILVPKAVALFRGMGAALPSVTLLALSASKSLRQWWLIALLIALDADMCLMLQHFVGSVARRWWSRLVWVAAVLTVALLAIGIGLPLASLSAQITANSPRQHPVPAARNQGVAMMPPDETATSQVAAPAFTPRALKTTPSAFANDVDPALDKISVTFDRPMMDKSWSFTAGDKAFSEQTGSIFPERAGEISYDAARTTCSMPVKLQPGKVYWVGINSPQHQQFKSADGTPARPHQILFATRSADGKPTPLTEELLKQARETNQAARDSGAAGDESLQGKLKTWVEDFFSHNYRDITARKTLEWGQAQVTAGGNLSIRYKYLATIWNKDQFIIEQRFTFTPEGKYVSAETIEQGPASYVVGGARATPEPSISKAAADAALPAAQAWLALLDEGKFEQSWEQAAKPLQDAIAKDRWIEAVKSTREPLGACQSRKLISATYTTSVPGAPDGHYVVIQFEAVFANKRQAVETVTPMREADGQWRVSGYYVR